MFSANVTLTRCRPNYRYMKETPGKDAQRRNARV